MNNQVFCIAPGMFSGFYEKLNYTCFDLCMTGFVGKNDVGVENIFELEFPSENKMIRFVFVTIDVIELMSNLHLISVINLS